MTFELQRKLKWNKYSKPCFLTQRFPFFLGTYLDILRYPTKCFCRLGFIRQKCFLLITLFFMRTHKIWLRWGCSYFSQYIFLNFGANLSQPQRSYKKKCIVLVLCRRTHLENIKLCFAMLYTLIKQSFGPIRARAASMYIINVSVTYFYSYIFVTRLIISRYERWLFTSQ